MPQPWAHRLKAKIHFTDDRVHSLSGKVIEVRKDKVEDFTNQRHEYNLLNADAIRRIDEKEALIVSSNRNPAIIKVVPYFNHSNLSRIPKRYGVAYLGNNKNSFSLKKVPLQ